ncbi:DUF3592 domain-containing protein [Actinophytocola sp.]|uniref:DUF3592 domain-containing protein n=1 Tax=Actinophytocola sp. TaxID=1872138 RepID=UPI002D8076C6|nr:DUF3592 domain-containing protein [Actinophytocola sp.]HET9142468.1 DUF3592 domain-containing protein [Actinophytocola sp.]
MPRFAQKIVLVVLAVQVAWSLPVAIWMGYLWRTTDEVDRSYACRGGATCYSGPTTYFILMLVFGAVALVMLIVLVVLATRWRRRSRRRTLLQATGLQVPGVLVRIITTNTRINGRRVYEATFESRTEGVPVRVVDRTTTMLRLGTQVTIVYDPADPSRAALAQDIETLATPSVFLDPNYVEWPRRS